MSSQTFDFTDPATWPQKQTVPADQGFSLEQAQEQADRIMQAHEALRESGKVHFWLDAYPVEIVLGSGRYMVHSQNEFGYDNLDSVAAIDNFIEALAPAE